MGFLLRMDLMEDSVLSLPPRASLERTAYPAPRPNHWLATVLLPEPWIPHMRMTSGLMDVTVADSGSSNTGGPV